MYNEKEYMKKYIRKYYQINKERILKHNKEYRIKNKEEIVIKSKQYREENKEKIYQSKKKYREKNKETLKKIKSKYYFSNKDKIQKLSRVYCIKNKEKRRKYLKENRENINKQAREYLTLKRKTDLRFNLAGKVSGLIRQSLKDGKDGKHWEDLVGYTLEGLIKRLKKTIPKGYVWQDYMEGKLHIDHIVPISAHNYNSFYHIDFINCWALSNLQLLPARENLIKSNHLTRPFQPALQISFSESN